MRVLIYPNITYQKDLEKDSYVVVLSNIIKELNKIRKDLEFVILSPSIIKSLQFPNTTQLILELPTYPNQMRLHFDSKRILKLLDWKSQSYDIVFSHLPEHTLQLKNLFYNETNERPVFIGYTHWTELKEITSYSMTVLDINILGLLEMLMCGVNTEAQKTLIINNAKNHFNAETIENLQKILTPLYLGAETPIYTPQPCTEKLIVFNHRPHKYKGYDWFLKQMDKLWEERKDFKVWVPLATSCDKEYMTNEKFDRQGYLSKLSSCYVGVCCEQKYAGWSVSATDGLSVGVPYLFSDNDYYHELAGYSGIYYKDKKEFLPNLKNILDSSDGRARWSEKSKERFEYLKWQNQIKPFNNMINHAIDHLPHLKKRTDSYLKILNIVKQNSGISKKGILKKLNWGVGIPWNPYKNMLRRDGVKIVNGQYIYGNVVIQQEKQITYEF